MKLCRNCRWYENGSCLSDKAFPPEEELNGVYVYYAEVMTVGPDFGCIHWEKSRKEDIKKEITDLAERLGVSLGEIENAIS